NGSGFRASAPTSSTAEATLDTAYVVHIQMARPMRFDEALEPELVGMDGKLPPIVLKEVYEQRFNSEDQAGKEGIWRELCRFLQRYVEPDARVVDIACDLGYFIRNIRAADRWATDIRDVAGSLPKDVHFLRASGLDLADVL